MPLHVVGYRKQDTFNDLSPTHLEAHERYEQLFLPVFRAAWRAATGQVHFRYHYDHGPQQLRRIDSLDPIEVPEGITVYAADASDMTETTATQIGTAVAESWQEYVAGEQHTRWFPSGYVLGSFAVDLAQLQS